MKLVSLLIVLSSPALRAQANSSTDQSVSPQWSHEEVSEKLKTSDGRTDVPPAKWTESQNDRLHVIFKRNHKSACKDATPKGCPAPEVHSKGGMVCVSANGKRYCKPMCNKGFDFSFLRISRLYEECSDATSFKWTTQYVGGNRLAVCNKSNIEIAARSSAYFPASQDCWTSKSNSTFEQDVINTFKNDLSTMNIQGPYTHECLMCG